MSNTEQSSKNAADVIPSDDKNVKETSVAAISPKKSMPPVYYGGITEDGSFVLMYEVQTDDKGSVKSKTWKSKASLNWRNFLRMMVSEVPVAERTGHLEKYKDITPLIPINTLNPEWISFNHAEIIESEKVSNSTDIVREKVKSAYDYASKIFSGEIEEKPAKSKSKIDADPNADPLTTESKAGLFKFISDNAPEGYELPELARTKKSELLEIAMAARDGKLSA